MTTNNYYRTPVSAPIPGRGKSIAGMTLGITGWALAVLSFGFLGFISLILWIIGLPLSAYGKQESGNAGAPTGMALAGLWTTGIGVAVSGLLIGLAIMSMIATA